MALPNLNRWTGGALVIGSLLFIVNKFNDMSQTYLNRPMPDLITGRDIAWLALGPVLLAIGCWGWYQIYAKRSSAPAKVGLAMLLTGAISLALGHASFVSFQAEPMFLFVILGVFLMTAGLILFGAVNLRLKAIRRWPFLPLVTGLLGFVGFVVFGGKEYPAIFLALRTLFGLGLVMMGVTLLLDTRGETTP